MTTERHSDYGKAIFAIGAALVVLFAAAGVIGAVGHTVPKELWAAGGALGGALVGVLVPAPKSAKEANAGAGAVAASYVHVAAVTAAQAKAAEIEQGNGDDATKAAASAALAQVLDAAKPPARRSSAAKAIKDAIVQHRSAATQAADPGDRDVKQAAADAAAVAAPQALAQANAAASESVSFLRQALKVIIPAVIFGVALYFGLRLADGSLGYPKCPVTTSTQAPCATMLSQTSNALIALASSAGGALIGLFASPPAQPGQPTSPPAQSGQTA